MALDKIAEATFEILCEIDCDGTKPWWGDNMPISSREMAHMLSHKLKQPISRYKALKAFHELEAEGLVQRGCVGCPAVEEGYEYTELVCEAAPPKHGYILTEKGINSDTYKEAQKAFEWSMAQLVKYHV